MKILACFIACFVHRYQVDVQAEVIYIYESQIYLQVRAIVEGQFLSKRAHAERFGMPSPPKRIIATGGASANNSILSLIASIFGCDVYTVQQPG